MAWAGGVIAPGPFYFPCGCDLTARMSPRHGGCPGATPGSRTNFHYIGRAPACAAESPKLSLPGAAPGRLANFHFGVVADKQCTCPASKLMRERYPPTPPFHCGENEIQASLINSASVGATPPPATNFGRSSGCRSVKPVSQTIVGSDDWSITSTSHHFGSVAQLAEQPVVCGEAEGANPFGSAIFQRVA